MKIIRIITTLSLCLLVTPVFAKKETITCVSVNEAFARCYLENADMRNVHIDQVVTGDCYISKAWGSDSTGIWVNKGCGAVFQYSAVSQLSKGFARYHYYHDPYFYDPYYDEPYYYEEGYFYDRYHYYRDNPDYPHVYHIYDENPNRYPYYRPYSNPSERPIINDAKTKEQASSTSLSKRAPGERVEKLQRDGEPMIPRREKQ